MVARWLLGIFGILISAWVVGYVSGSFAAKGFALVWGDLFA